jgi:hypothetical protein
MESRTQDLDHKGWEMLVGTWSIEASHRVHRIFTLSFVDGTLRYARNAAAPDFSQRLTLTVSGDANTITGRAELSPDGVDWQNDLAITYRRVR